MNTNWRRGILWALNALGAFVGAWALAAPRSFYDGFPMPGLLGAWVASDGPYNEHLVRDVGSLYLALARGLHGVMSDGAGAPGDGDPHDASSPSLIVRRRGGRHKGIASTSVAASAIGCAIASSGASPCRCPT